MQIIYRPTFEFNLLRIIDFIVTDKPKASVNFANELEKLIFNLPNFPYKNRQSIYFNDENIRDMVFKGYTIVYKINIQKNLIEILDIFNQNKR